MFAISRIDGQHDVQMYRTATGYRVEYGAVEASHPTLDQAVYHYKAAVNHQMTCAGFNDTPESNND